jgi:hypothetical protein
MNFAGGAVALALAAVPPGEPTAARWLRDLQEARALLLEARWEEAEAQARALHTEIAHDLKGGEAANDLAGTALAELALAEAGLGRREEAVWHLQCAASFHPGFREASLAEFGEAGAALAAAARAVDPTLATPLDLVPAPPGFEPPAILEAPYVVFLAGLEVLQALDPELRVRVVVAPDGSPRRPEVLGRLDNPGAVLLSLEQLRLWRFTPARLAGRPVAVYLELGLPLTRGTVERARALLAAEEP